VRREDRPSVLAALLAARGVRSLKRIDRTSCLDSFYAEVPCRYPAVFETLVAEYGWQELEIGDLDFASNPPGPSLGPLAKAVRYDPTLWDFLLHHRYLIFGRMSRGRYDPVAFDMNRPRGDDAPVVRVDHEEILSFNRLGRPTELARSLVAYVEGSVGGGAGRLTRA
jgi:hypothetical protein